MPLRMAQSTSCGPIATQEIRAFGRPSALSAMIRPVARWEAPTGGAAVGALTDFVGELVAWLRAFGALTDRLHVHINLAQGAGAADEAETPGVVPVFKYAVFARHPLWVTLFVCAVPNEIVDNCRVGQS